ncbi:RluA family pseudouridine synthase [Pseudodesulfovibrio tunisiensis]|uniref:RluA family pseudouridine synthase n=1 Tax=Pseudodesulfovibrio tunisiensis TaxID=463192 RepID=UPI001FB1C8DA|nr:RluA family pseudouridine synthase [Pseudodesulfovibrio tunisiensis]
MPKVQNIIVSQAEAGQKLVQFLERRLGRSVPRSAIMRWIRKGEVRVDKGRKKPFDRVDAGQTVRIPPFEPGNDSRAVAPADAPALKISYHDDQLLAVAKPAGLAAHGGDGITDSVAGRLRLMFPNAEFTPTLAHRLDRDTSGMLLVARTYDVLRELNDLFAAGKVGKLYLAWVQGRWDEPGVTLLEDRMQKEGAPGRQKVRTGRGKTALAKVMGLVSGRHHSLVAVRLLTGRTHQIRVQLASRNHPIAGDMKYGEHGRPPMRLHCYAIRLPERTLTLPPVWSGKWMVPPDALREAIELLYEE